MLKVLVVYYSRSGNTKTMAETIAKAISKEGVEVDCKKVQETSVDDLLDVDGVVVGSPTYYGTMAAEVKKFFDDSVKHHGKLDGKVGAAFSSAEVTGQETTVLSILKALIIHGMIIQGNPEEYHYGATSIEKPDERNIKVCQRFGKRVANLVKRVAGE
jgi:NAD(P)H dehydrogenase (quinone)